MHWEVEGGGPSKCSGCSNLRPLVACFSGRLDYLKENIFLLVYFAFVVSAAGPPCRVMTHNSVIAKLEHNHELIGQNLRMIRFSQRENLLISLKASFEALLS